MSAFDSPPIVTLKDVFAGYGRTDVLKAVSIEFRRGEVFALLGPNGAGKSTLMRILTGALMPRQGEVRFASGRRAVGLAPQQVALYPALSPRENAIAFGRLAGLSQAVCRRRLDLVMRLSGCESVENTPVVRLSGGFQRRANIAAALMDEPELLVLDEPTANLDAEGRAHVGAVVQALRGSGTGVLLVTHDFGFAEGLADRVGILKQGSFVGARPPAAWIADQFGDRDLVEVTLKQAPDPATRARLDKLGAEPTLNPLCYRVWRARDGAGPPDLAAAGLAFAELRVRPPGLADLFAAACAEGPPA